MGQTIGRAPLKPEATHFLNLPRSCIHDLWECFNDVAEGFGLTQEEFQEILRVCLRDYLTYTEKKINEISSKLFDTFDDDHNGLIDALEFLASFSLVSGMTLEEKVRFIFGIYDFDESGVLNVDEMNLALRSSISGLCKLSGVDPPLESDIEHIAVAAFEDSGTLHGGNVAVDAFVLYCRRTPEIQSWIEYYGEIEELFLNRPADPVGEERVKLRLRHEAHAPDRGADHQAAMDPDGGWEARLAQEALGPAADLPRHAPWENAVPFTEPTHLPKETPNTAPDTNLELDWAYGYNARGQRQNAFYDRANGLVYPAGAAGVVLDLETRRQRYFLEHTDLVTCLRVHHFDEQDGGTHAATGQLGARPKICVWRTADLVCVAALRGFHTHGVRHVAFSLRGDRVCSVGADPRHMVAVYDWAARELLFTAPGHPGAVLECRAVSHTTFVTCGQDHVYFWMRLSRASYRREKGLYGRKVVVQPALCAAGVDDMVATGMLSGHLYIWEGRNCVNSIKGHSGAVTCIQALGEGGFDGCVTASSDGKVQVWSRKFEVGATFDLTALGAQDRMAQSLCWDREASKFLLGFYSAELYEMDDSEGLSLHQGPVVQGHFAGAVGGLAFFPLNPAEFLTAGADRTVRVWRADRRSLKKMCQLDAAATCAAYSPDGSMIVVGMGGADRKSGAYCVLNEEDLTVLHEARDSKQPLSAAAFAPDGRTLALASEDGAVYLYNVGDWVSKAKCRGHHGKVLQLDFSADSKHLQTTCSAEELLFWEAETGEQVPPRNVRDVLWESQSCVHGWPLQGAASYWVDGNRIAGACRSQNGEVLATIDRYGRLRVHRYPCLDKHGAYLEYLAHGGPGHRLGFTADDAYLLSTGLLDGVVLQWRHAPEKDFNPELPTVTEAADHKGAADLQKDTQYDRKHQIAVANEGRADFVWAMEERADEEDFLPVKAWHRAVVAPSRAPPEDLREPDDDLALEHVHGYRCHDVRGNLRYTHGAGEAVFHVGKTAVVMNTKDNEQRFHQDHTDDILSLDLHPSKPLVATGQAGAPLPEVLIWDYNTMETAICLRGHHQRGVSIVRFSPDGRLLATVGLDHWHTLAIYDWENQALVSHAKTEEVKILDLVWTPDGQGLVQCGFGFIRFWRQRGHLLGSALGLLAPRGKLQPLYCLAWAGNAPVAGTFDGHLYRFVGRQLDAVVEAHAGPVYTLMGTNEGLVSGGQDGFVKVWTTSLECRLFIDMKTLGSLRPPVRAAWWDNEAGRLLAGTLGGEVWELNAYDGANIREAGPAVQGHAGPALAGLACHPTRAEFATAGDDATLRVWDVYKKSCIKVVELEMAARAVAYSPDGERMAVGMGAPNKASNKQFDGKWIVLNVEDYVVVHEARDSQKYITELKFSPNGHLLAVGSFDNKVYLYDVRAAFTLSAVVTQHNSFITHLDFSSDSSHIQTTCGAYELMFFESATGMHVPAASRLKDVEWASQTATLGWAVQGIWPPENDKLECSAVDCNMANRSGRMAAASGDTAGRLKLFRYPVTSSYAAFKLYPAHSSSGGGISQVRWAGGDSHLITAGMGDCAVFQWRHEAETVAAVEARDEEGNPEEEAEIEAEMAAEAGPGGGHGAGGEGADGEEGSVAGDNRLVMVRPWLSQVVEPTEAPPPDPRHPGTNLRLAWVFGCSQQGASARSCALAADGRAVYCAARTAVVYGKAEHEQAYYRGHAHQITALAMAPGGRYAATGERCPRPRVHVWDALTCRRITVLPEYHRQGIAALAFSQDARRLISVGEDVDHTIVIWSSVSGEWYDARRQAAAKGNKKRVIFGFFCSPEKEYQLVTGGVGHVSFWKLRGKWLAPRPGVLGSAGKVPETMLCGTEVGRAVVSGSITGHLFVWSGRRLEKAIRAHESRVNACAATAGGLLTGSADGFVKLWSRQLEHRSSYDLQEAQTAPVRVEVKSVAAGLDVEGKEISKILVGTAGSEIYEISRESGYLMLLQEGHCQGEVWGVCTHPTDPDQFCTVGDDATIRIWSIGLKRLLRKTVIDSTARCVAWSPDGKYLLVGLGGHVSGARQKKDGAFMVLDALTLDVLFEGRDSRHWARDVKWSPDGALFGVASMDQKLYLYDARSYVLKAKCEKHNSYISFFDFSHDSYYVQSDSADFEHLYHYTTDGAHTNLTSQLKNVDWASYTCTYGWPVQGCWPSFSGGAEGGGAPSEVTACHRAPRGRRLLAAADEAGELRVYRYPCTDKKAEFARESCHSSHVASARFTSDDSHIVTIGKHDRAVVVWAVDQTEPFEDASPSLTGSPAKRSSAIGQPPGASADAGAPERK